MLTFIIRRAFLALLTVWALSLISFVVITLPPGDFVSGYIQEVMGADAASSAAAAELERSLRLQYGLDQPMIVQYAKWAWKLLHFDLGISLEFRQPVRQVIGERLLMTVILAGSTALMAWALSIPIGIYSAMRQHSLEDYTVTFIGFLGLAVPDFLLALVLLWISFTVFDQSVGGLFSPHYLDKPWTIGRVVDLLSHLWIAALVVGTAGTAALIRVMRANLLDELRKPYVVTARSKGLAEWKVIIKYPVRIALNPLVSTMGYLLPFLMSGSIIVSVVLGLPTEGPILLRALLTEDLFVSSSIVLLLGILTVVGTFISDIILALIDPRIRMS